MNIRNTIFLLLCVLVLGAACTKNKENSGDSPQKIRLSRFGVSLDLPEGFVPINKEQFAALEQSPLASLRVEPFNISLLQAYRTPESEAILFISALEFTDPQAKSNNPMSNLYDYQKNLEAYFGVEEISSEEIEGKELSLVILAMIVEEAGENYALIKGLCYKYPDHFFMIDLLAQQAAITAEDAQGYRNMFLSLNIY